MNFSPQSREKHIISYKCNFTINLAWARITAVYNDEENMIIVKFGGTSVSSKSRVLNICEIVSKRVAERPVVVVSALAGVTDLLLSITKFPQKSKNNISKVKELHVDLIKGIWKEPSSINRIVSYIDSVLAEVRKLVKNHNLAKSSVDKLSSFGEIMSCYVVSEALKQSGVNSQQVLATELIVTDSNFGEAEFIPEAT